MIKQNECEGLPVIDINNGNIIGRFKEFLFLGIEKKVFGILLEDSFFATNEVILLDDIVKLGKDAFVVKSENVILKLKTVLRNNKLKKAYHLKNKDVYTNKGINLGTVRDIRINELDGEIECLEISYGIVSDILNGRSILPLIGRVLFSKDSILVENQAYEELKLSNKGLNNYIGGVLEYG